MRPLYLTTNTVIWAVALLLQCVLAVVAFHRGVGRLYPVFTAMLLFQPARSALMFSISGRADTDLINALYYWGSILDVGLQFFVAVELTVRLVREKGGWTWLRGTFSLLIVTAAFVGTRGTLHVLPHRLANSPLQLFVWFVLLALAAVVGLRCRRVNLLQIAAGLGAFSLVQLAAVVGRAMALVHRNGGQYYAWSYVPALAYVGVVAFWIVALQPYPT